MLNEINIKEFNEQLERNSSSSINLFYKKFKQIQSEKESYIEFLINEYINKANIFSELILKAKPEIDNYFKTETPSFNVFKIIGLHRKEVITHTPFLANLLSPFDTHQQSFLFLRNFFEQVLSFSKQEIEHHGWYVIKEFEYIDLRIVNDALKKAVYIENKIDTSAHSGQLSHYFRNWKRSYSGGAFIYLTINGDLPPDEGFDEDIYPKNKVLCELKTLSYKNDIYKWLESCIENLPSKKVYYTVRQYLELLKLL